ncbi:MAG TPA: hypothetical protein VGH20_10980, partial [Myxococcales bacterium]
ILALPALQLMRERDPTPTGELDPVLSSLFRVIDGVRLVSAHLLDLFDFPMTHETLIAAKDITGGAERFDQYRSGRGVCAGPPAMIDALVDTVMNGTPVANDTPLGPWTASIPRALDYALRGIQLYAAIFSIWLRMALTYTRIRERLQRGEWQGRLGLLRTAVERDFPLLAAGRLHLPEQRAFSEAYYRRMFNNAQAGIRGVSSMEMKNLAVELAPPPRLLGETAGAALAEVFVAAEEPQARKANRECLQEVAAHVLDYLRFERNALGTVCAVQREINVLLGRPQPSQPLTGLDLAMFHTIRRGTRGKGLRYLIETLQETLGIAIHNHKDATAVACAGRTTILH